MLTLVVGGSRPRLESFDLSCARVGEGSGLLQSGQAAVEIPGEVLVSCTEICGVLDARVTVLAKESHQHHGSTP
ncbi:hypothetical protein AMK26_30290 [Streptomyces sp. CB03234]|uniref:hypothetical protein n=1 Tax=Streptomyces sp. (strain CB03234) TaxID=1703937 RepID=UPI00093A3B9D|nr:hypothetical protein [Streptomyces sp. CB03234]OKJ94931.1 hypothetical protein AMK26_30290 [Streptomyces sp. CB03234]